MRRGYLPIFACLLLAFVMANSAFAQSVDVAAFQRDFETLSSYPSRAIGSPGYDKAAAYIEQQFNVMAVEWRRHEFPVMAPVTTSATLAITPGAKPEPVYPLWPAGVRLCSTPAEGITGKLVYCGTGTYDLHTIATDIQAGSYALMDTAYTKLGLPFAEALAIVGTIVSTSTAGYAVADVGLKALGMDHGNSAIDGAQVWFFSDEHVTFAPERPVRVGDRVRVRPAHVDPTMAYHERAYVVEGERVVDTWLIDLRGW